MRRNIWILAPALALGLAVLLAVPARPAGDAPRAGDGAAAAPVARGFLGVALEELTPELQRHFGAPEGSGVLVASVSGDGPAATAGVRVGDVITAVDGLAVDSARDLGREVRHRPGETVTLELYRDRRPREITVTLGERQARPWGAGKWPHGGPEEWGELAEHWQRWAEELGEELGERWGEKHAESWQRWAEEMAERGEGWEKMGEEIGRTVEKALAEVDWEAIGRSIEESMSGLEEIDWEKIGDEVERGLREAERHLERQRHRQRSDAESE